MEGESGVLVWKFDGEGGGAPVSGPAWGDKHEVIGRSASKLWRSCLELEEKGDSSGGVTGKEKYKTGTESVDIDISARAQVLSVKLCEKNARSG